MDSKRDKQPWITYTQNSDTFAKDKRKWKGAGPWQVWGIGKGFFAKVKFHLGPEAGGAGEGNCSRLRNS